MRRRKTRMIRRAAWRGWGTWKARFFFKPPGENEWVGAVRNIPMTTGDKLWVDRESRAEIQLGSSTIDMGPATRFFVLESR